MDEIAPVIMEDMSRKTRTVLVRLQTIDEDVGDPRATRFPVQLTKDVNVTQFGLI